MGTPNVLFLFNNVIPAVEIWSGTDTYWNQLLEKLGKKYVQQPKMQFVGQIIMFWILVTAGPLHYLVDLALCDYLLATSRSS